MVVFYSPEPSFEPAVLPEQVPKTAIPSYAKEEGIVADWLFYNGAGDVIRDFSGNGYHGEINGPKWTGGIASWMLSFDGSDDYVSPGSLDVDWSSGWTFLAWIYTFSDHNGIFFSGDGAGTDRSFQLKKKDTGKIRCIYSSNDDTLDALATIAETDAAIANDEWIHVGFRHGSDGVQLYINSNPDGSNAGVMDNSGPANPIGMQAPGNNTNPYDGMVALMQVYNVDKGASFISDHYERTRVIFGV